MQVLHSKTKTLHGITEMYQDKLKFTRVYLLHGNTEMWQEKMKFIRVYLYVPNIKHHTDQSHVTWKY